MRVVCGVFPGRKQLKSIQGFSVLEMTLVLGVIGILIAAALGAKPMIMNAKATRTVGDLQMYQASFQMYTENYGFMPGDDKYAGDRFDMAGVTGPNGNGDGSIEGDEDRVWQHMRAAGFVKGHPDNDTGPANSFGGVFFFREKAFANGLKGIVLCVNKVPGDVASIIDNKLDDGTPDTGSVMSAEDSGKDDIDYSTEPLAAAYSSSKAYILCSKMN